MAEVIDLLSDEEEINIIQVCRKRRPRGLGALGKSKKAPPIPPSNVTLTPSVPALPPPPHTQSFRKRRPRGLGALGKSKPTPPIPPSLPSSPPPPPQTQSSSRNRRRKKKKKRRLCLNPDCRSNPSDELTKATESIQRFYGVQAYRNRKKVCLRCLKDFLVEKNRIVNLIRNGTNIVSAKINLGRKTYVLSESDSESSEGGATSSSSEDSELEYCVEQLKESSRGVAMGTNSTNGNREMDGYATNGNREKEGYATNGNREMDGYATNGNREKEGYATNGNREKVTNWNREKGDLEDVILNIISQFKLDTQMTEGWKMVENKLKKAEKNMNNLDKEYKSIENKLNKLRLGFYNAFQLEEVYQPSLEIGPPEIFSGTSDVTEVITQPADNDAEAYLPTIGPLIPKEVEVGHMVYMMKYTRLSKWIPARVTKVELLPNLSETYYHVSYDKDYSGEAFLTNTLSAKFLAYFHECPTRIPLGTRVIARVKDDGLGSFYVGIVAEMPTGANKFRYLIFFDDGYAQYSNHIDLRVVVQRSEPVWEDVDPGSRDFIRDYLNTYPEKPMVRLQRRGYVKTEFQGTWYRTEVLSVDCSLVKLQFPGGNRRSEWIYRGSTRLLPLFQRKMAAATRGAVKTEGPPSPPNRVARRRTMPLRKGGPVLEYIKVEEEEEEKENLPPVPEPVSEPVSERVSKPVPERVSEPVLSRERVSEPILSRERWSELVPERVSEPVLSRERGSEPVPERVSEPVPSRERWSEPVPERVSEPVLSRERGSELVPERVSEPVPSRERWSEPVPERVSEPVLSRERGSELVPERVSEPVLSRERGSEPVPERVSEPVNSRERGSEPVPKRVSEPVLSRERVSKPVPERVSEPVLSRERLTPFAESSPGGPPPPSNAVVTRTTAAVSTPKRAVARKSTAARSAVVREVSMPEPVHPMAEPVHPMAEPTHPMSEPAHPASEPAHPVSEPAHPILEPVHPVSEPMLPMSQQLALEGKGRLKTVEWVPRTGRFSPHQCMTSCVKEEDEEVLRSKAWSPLLKPLIVGWNRHVSSERRRKAMVSGGRTCSYVAPCGRRLRSLEEVARYLKATRSKLGIDLFTMDADVNIPIVWEPCRRLFYVEDIAEGKERVNISCVNALDRGVPRPMVYTSERIPSERVKLDLDPGFLVCCSCEGGDCSDPAACECARLTYQAAKTSDDDPINAATTAVRTGSAGGDSVNSTGYVYKRLYDQVVTGIYECNSRCRCSSKSCSNRVVQLGIQQGLQLFKTAKRGWGIRTLHDIPRGSFLCTYVGKLLTEAEANEEGTSDGGDEFYANLDFIEVVEGMKEGYESDVEEEEGEGGEEEEGEEERASRKRRGRRKEEEEDEEFSCKVGQRNGGDLEVRERSVRIQARTLTVNIDDEDEGVGGDSGRAPSSFEPRDDVMMRMGHHPNHNNQLLKLSFPQSSTGTIQERTPSSFEPRQDAMIGVGRHPNNDYPPPPPQSIRQYYAPNESVYVMDAKHTGNIGRYLNHSCDPNVFVQNVFVDTHDPRFPWISFFAGTRIRAGSELTWDYNYEVGSVPGRVKYCYCGSPNCRGRLL